MTKVILNLRKKLKNAPVLACLFLIYIFTVGMAALPDMLYNTADSLKWDTGPFNLMKVLTSQYEGMLTTDQENSLLQNKGTYINLNGAMARILGQPMMNNRILLKNGHVSTIVSDAPDSENIRDAAHNLALFHEKQSQTGKDFLFVLAPSQISKYEDLLPTGYTDTTNETADQLLTLLDDSGVPYLDLRLEMQEEGISTTEAFFNTDHHWLPQTGLWAYTKILEKLEQMDVISKPDDLYTNTDNFSFQTYADTFLGSSGKRTGAYYAGLDDSIFLLPNFETEISVTIPERNLSRTGPYEEVCYNTDAHHDMENPDYFQENMYGLYGWGDTKLTQWRNAKAPIQEKMLLIGESFGNIPFSLMSIVYASCDEMDMRHFDGDFAAYYADYDPDTVIILANVDMCTSIITTYPFFSEASQ